NLLFTGGETVIVPDPREEIEPADELRRAGVVLELGGHRAETLNGADLIVLSPGASPRQAEAAAARAAGVAGIAELELASRWLSGRIVAVTGTKGKSTTTTLIGRMLEAGGLKAAVGGNIGVPLSAQVAASTPDVIHVVEASSFQLETTEQFRPWIALLVTLAADHLDRHDSLEAYAAAKGRIFANQHADDFAVVNVDDPAPLALARTRARLVPLSPSAAIADGIVVTSEAIAHRRAGVDAPLVPVSAVRLLGRHPLTDVAAAPAVAEIAGVSPEAMVRAVEGFTGLEHAL